MEQGLQAQWAKKGVRDHIPVSGQGLHQLLIRQCVTTECCSRRVNGAFEHGNGTIIEWMRQRSRGVNPLQAVLLERQAAEECRTKPKWVNCRADIVYKTGQGELHRTRTAPDALVGLVHYD